MADNTRVNELQDKLLKAMDILNAQALNSISFDKTITCKIENDKDKKDGKYEVNDGNRIFVAYSTDTRLRADDTVYVTVPEGNFENQKMIIGKKTADNDKPFNFTQPFDTFFDMTGNLASEKNVEVGLLANDDLKDAILPDEYHNSIMLVGKKTNEGIEMIDVKSLDIIQYPRLALRADFRTWIKNAIIGEYGLNIYLRTIKPKTTTEKNETQSEEDKYEQKDYRYNWNNSMMYGNPYNFETYYSQEIVLDLAQDDIGQVVGIAIEFYQKANFYDKFNTKIPYLEEVGDKKLEKNIFINNLEVYFGKDISNFASDFVEIYTPNGDSYKRSVSANDKQAQQEIENNRKEIKLRWVHLKDGEPIDMREYKNQEDIQYEVRWYRYRVGVAAADEYCGIYWENITLESEYTRVKQQMEIELADLKTKTQSMSLKQYQQKEKEIQDLYLSKIRHLDSLSDFSLIFNPDVNKQQEYIKAIVLCNNIPYRSNELIFKNDDELPPSQEAQHIANALNIKCNDNSNGNYLVYGQGTYIKDDALAKQERTLSCYFDTNNDGEHESKISDHDKITWIFPRNNTMIEVVENQEGKTENETQIIVQQAEPKYRIPRVYNSYYSNNTIQCIYELNNVVYSTEIEFTFGKAGTMGSDQTLVIDFVGDQKAYEIGQEVVQFKLRVNDHVGNDQSLNDNDVIWKWYYNNEQEAPELPKTGSVLTFERPNWSIDKLHILEASVGQLTTYFSIPIKENIENTNCAYISGATEVVYQSDGIADYSKQPYQIYDKEGKIISGVNWEIILPEDAYSYTYYGKISEFKDNTYYSKEELQDGDGKFTGYTYNLITNNNWNSSTPYYIKVKDNYVGQINKDTKVLEPVNLYVKDAPIYGIKATLSGKTIWSQPIFVCQNKWPSTVINQWDGKSLQLDEENSAVIAAAVSAGKKNSEDNTFSGVMIGDWSGKDLDTGKEIANQTGVYGFHHGAMSYAFKEDGTAFIGKYGRGRIYFDGDNSTIYSKNYTNDYGMKIDLGGDNTPYIDMKSGLNNYIKMDFNNNTPRLKVQSGDSYFLLDTESNASKIYLKGSRGQKAGAITLSTKSTDDPLTIGNNFRVEWDGTLHATNGNFSGTIDADDGTLSNLDIDGNLSIVEGGALYLEAEKYTRDGPIYVDYNDRQLGSFGLVVGKDGDTGSTTYNIGITSSNNVSNGTNKPSIVLESQRNVRLSANEQIFIDAPAITFKCEAANQHGIYARFA